MVGNQTIKRKLMLTSMVGTGICFSFAACLLVVNEITSYRQELLDSLRAQARIVAWHSTAALAFGIQKDAEELVQAFSAAPNIVSAIIYLPDGSVFATYRSSAVPPQAPPPLKDALAPAVTSEYISFSEPVVLDKEVVGTIYLKSDLKQLHDRIYCFLGILGAVLLGAMAAAYLLFSRLQRSITRPIADLMRVMGAVSDHKDYSVRCDVQSNDELGTLAGGFNYMLSQIYARDLELEEHREHLENLVAKRTAELAETNERLETELAERKKAEVWLKKYSDGLQETNEELKNFNYIVSHDLRTPLVSIKGFSGELRLSVKEVMSLLAPSLDGMQGEGEQKIHALLHSDIPEALEFIESSIDGMDSLINGVQKLSLAWRRELKLNQVNTRELVREVVHSYSRQLEQKKVRVTLEELPVLFTDRNALEHIVRNLVDNAIKYLRRDCCGEIAIYSQTDNDTVTVHIRDNGRGIAREDLGKIFETFRRSGRNDDTNGEGLGLAYVKTLIRRLGGQIECRSEVGQGSTFSFTLPTTPLHWG